MWKHVCQNEFPGNYGLNFSLVTLTIQMTSAIYANWEEDFNEVGKLSWYLRGLLSVVWEGCMQETSVSNLFEFDSYSVNET